jgi:hypothetical protein
MINWQYYPKSDQIPDHLLEVEKTFQTNEFRFKLKKGSLISNDVLEIVGKDLEKLGFRVERGVTKKEKIVVPVLFGRNGMPEKTFEADAYNRETQTVIEVEAGRGVLNNQFLKDFFQACVMYNVEYLVIALRNMYKGSHDFDRVFAFFDTIYASGRLQVPLKGLLILGYDVIE